MPDIGTGSTVTFATSAITVKLTSIEWSGIGERESVDISHMGLTTWREFALGRLGNPGLLTLEGLHTKDDGGNWPLVGAAETITVALPLQTGDTTPEKFAATGGIMGLTISIPNEDVITFSATLQMSGTVTFTDIT